MNRWARRHRALLEVGLEDGERLLAAQSVSTRSRRVDTPLVLPARIFALGVTDRRLVVWRTSRWLAHPRELTFAVPLAAVTALRSGRGPAAHRVTVRVGTSALPLAALAPFASARPLSRAFTAARGYTSK